METLVISEQRRQHHHHSSARRKKASAAASHFSSPQSMRGLQAGNCRAFHSGMTIGVLPSPPVPRAYSPEPKTPKQQQHHGKKRSRAISISPSTSPPTRPELWAGPGFSNSPPPSSLPIPKFSLHQKRSVSLEFPPTNRSDGEDVRVNAKSAPSSPTAGSGACLFSGSDTAIATENLRRILHLKITEN
ncbi:hypothetical protein PR202_ga26980 [Eleusine coracana subsp. coracana]|uniref:Uncharacterized protein n=1 Tax=Eleusine coracana subsp. coracana TaxID=191504 RepID=A0AAV5DDF3_ELECO|nr:hypothetical protein QOZ80_3AG0234600 [Eleusine coracana subsp. coracana]GJN09014.1 hypothetical protein PR202_ga26980 [Eleusine coracana subsp. coracana]